MDIQNMTVKLSRWEIKLIQLLLLPSLIEDFHYEMMCQKKAISGQ